MRSSNPGATACQTSPLPLRSAQQALELVPSPENEDLLNPAAGAKASRGFPISPSRKRVSPAPARTCLSIRKWKAGSKKASVLGESNDTPEQMTLVGCFIMFDLLRPAFHLCRRVSFRFLWLPHQSHHSPALRVARRTSIDILVTC